MNNIFSTSLSILAILFSASAMSAPGEYWEITSSSEMEGMPFAMPADTQKVCIAKGGERDPSKMNGDKDCQVTDSKTVGNKFTWKMRCDHKGDVMTGSGEQTMTATGYQAKMQFSGRSDGQPINMTTKISGKRIGGSCDSEELQKKMKATQDQYNAQMCASSNAQKTSDLIYSSSYIMGAGNPCPKQRKELCDAVRKDAPRDPQAYYALATHNKQNNSQLVKECKLDMAATTKAICKTLNGKNYDILASHCPAEAKTHREVQRRKDCEGRSYTAETRAADFKKCMSGQSDTYNSSSSSEEEPAPTPIKPNKSGTPATDTSAQEMLESAKKLKGMFNF